MDAAPRGGSARRRRAQYSRALARHVSWLTGLLQAKLSHHTAPCGSDELQWYHSRNSDLTSKKNVGHENFEKSHMHAKSDSLPSETLSKEPVNVVQNHVDLQIEDRHRIILLEDRASSLEAKLKQDFFVLEKELNRLKHRHESKDHISDVFETSSHPPPVSAHFDSVQVKQASGEFDGTFMSAACSVLGTECAVKLSDYPACSSPSLDSAPIAHFMQDAGLSDEMELSYANAADPVDSAMISQCSFLENRVKSLGSEIDQIYIFANELKYNIALITLKDNSVNDVLAKNISAALWAACRRPRSGPDRWKFCILPNSAMESRELTSSQADIRARVLHKHRQLIQTMRERDDWWFPFE